MEKKRIPSEDCFMFNPFPLSAREWGKICHEINGIYWARYEGKRICTHLSFDLNGNAFIYYFENLGFSKYNIFLRVVNDN